MVTLNEQLNKSGWILDHKLLQYFILFSVQSHKCIGVSDFASDTSFRRIHQINHRMGNTNHGYCYI